MCYRCPYIGESVGYRSIGLGVMGGIHIPPVQSGVCSGRDLSNLGIIQCKYCIPSPLPLSPAVHAQVTVDSVLHVPLHPS